MISDDLVDDLRREIDDLARLYIGLRRRRRRLIDSGLGDGAEMWECDQSILGVLDDIARAEADLPSGKGTA